MAIGSTALILGLAACAPGAGQSDNEQDPDAKISTDISGVDDTTLTVWDQEVRGGQKEQIETLNAAFEKKYPNVTIDRVSQSFEDLNTTLRLALTDKDEAPDVVQANNARATMGAFVKSGQLRDLDDYADAYGWTDRYAESILKLSTYSDDAAVFGDGNLYGLPQVGEAVGIFYSKSKLTELGLDVPSDWADFDQALATAKDAGETPMLLGNIEQWPAVHVFGPLQGDYVDADTITDLALGNPGASWKSPENIEAADAMQSWVDKGFFNEGVNGTDYDKAWQSLAAGDGVFLMAGSWLAADIDEAMGNDDLGFFVPATDDGTLTTTGGTGLPFTMTSAAENTDVAAAYIDFITNDSAMETLAETGNLPVNRTAELAPKSGVLGDVYTTFGEVTENGALLPYLDYATPTFDETLGQSLQDLIAGRITSEKFTTALEADYAKFVESNE